MRVRAGKLFLAAALFALPGLCLALEEQSLLTPDGTTFVVRAGKAIDLGVSGLTSPDSYVIEWSSRAQDGTVATGLIPGMASNQEKRGLQLAFDESTGKLLLMWIERVSAYSHVRVAVLKNGVWSNSALLPNTGISRAYNPQMRVTHQPVTTLDENDAVVSSVSSVLSVVWWEEAEQVQARYATVFLDEDTTDPASLEVYDLPLLAGETGGASSYPDDVPSGAYLYPSLQTDGLSGVLLASFADLGDQKHKILRIEFPGDRGKPTEKGNLKWQRRHIPIVGISTTGPVARMAPVLPRQTDPDAGVHTTIGSGYRPTISWRDGDALKFTRLDGADWAPVGSIPIDENMTYEKALALVVGMGTRN